MTKSTLINKYPINSIEFTKDETKFNNIDEIVEYLQTLISNHPIAVEIAVFDHLQHTLSIEDHILDENIKAAKNVVFCFGKKLPSSKMLAVRPRSIGVCDLGDKFEISFLEVPNEELQKTTEDWVKSVINN